MEQVVWELLQIVGRQVKLLQVCALVEVTDAFVVNLVVGQVEHFQVGEVLFAQRRNLCDRVVLQIQV